MKVQHFFDGFTNTLTYVVFDEETKVGVVVDPVTNYEPNSGRTSDQSNEEVAVYIDQNGIELLYALDTHAHADHFTGLPYFKER